MTTSYLQGKWVEVAIGLLVAAVGANMVLEYFALNYNYYDTGCFANPIANLAHGHGYFNSDLGVSAFADHFTPGLILLSPLYQWLDHPMILPVLKWVSFVLSVVALRKLLLTTLTDKWLQNLLLLLWVANPGTVNYMGFEFQSSNFIVPLVFWSFDQFIKKNYGWFMLACFLAMSFKENGALLVISVGLFGMVLLRRYTVGLATALMGVACLASIVWWLQPDLADAKSIHAASIDPFCCLRAKTRFAATVLWAAGSVLFFFPSAWLALVPGFAASLLINRPGAHTLTFHYQDIPLAICFALTAFMLGKNGIPFSKNERWAKPVSLVLGLLVLSSVAMGLRSFNFLVRSNIPTLESVKAVEQMATFAKQHNKAKTVWAQTPLAFYLSSEFRLKCLMDPHTTLTDTAANYVVLCDLCPNRWPIDGGYDALKSSLLRDVSDGKRTQLKQFLPLLVFEIR